MLNRLLHDTSASLTMEAAFCVPLLVIMNFGGFMAADLTACDRRVSIASRTLADLVSRSLAPSLVTLHPDEFDGSTYLSASALTLVPYSADPADMEVALLRICDATHAYVIWSQVQKSQDGVAYTPSWIAGTLSATSVVPLPDNMVTTLVFKTSPLVPTSPDGSDICSNFDPTSTDPVTGQAKIQVGTAGGYLFVSKVTYNYTTELNPGFLPTYIPFSYVTYMGPRLS